MLNQYYHNTSTYHYPHRTDGRAGGWAYGSVSAEPDKQGYCPQEAICIYVHACM